MLTVSGKQATSRRFSGQRSQALRHHLSRTVKKSKEYDCTRVSAKSSVRTVRLLPVNKTEQVGTWRIPKKIQRVSNFAEDNGRDGSATAKHQRTTPAMLDTKARSLRTRAGMLLQKPSASGQRPGCLTQTTVVLRQQPGCLRKSQTSEHNGRHA